MMACEDPRNTARERNVPLIRRASPPPPHPGPPALPDLSGYAERVRQIADLVSCGEAHMKLWDLYDEMVAAARKMDGRR